MMLFLLMMKMNIGLDMSMDIKMDMIKLILI